MMYSVAVAHLAGERPVVERVTGRGLHSLTSELNLRTFGTHHSR